MNEVMNPAKVVDLGDGKKANVFPMGIKHIGKFSKRIAGVLGAFGSITIKKESTPEEIATAALSHAMPIVLTDLLDLVSECVTFDSPTQKFEDLAHWELPVIVDAWVEMNFGEEKKWRPWVATMEKAIAKASGKEFSISSWMSAMRSKASSPKATTSKASSTDTAPGGLTADGPSTS